jgi:hypothetical protein
MARLLIVGLFLVVVAVAVRAEINFGHQKCGDPNCQSKPWGFSFMISFYTFNVFLGLVEITLFVLNEDEMIYKKL